MTILSEPDRPAVAAVSTAPDTARAPTRVEDHPITALPGSGTPAPGQDSAPCPGPDPDWRDDQTWPWAGAAEIHAGDGTLLDDTALPFADYIRKH